MAKNPLEPFLFRLRRATADLNPGRRHLIGVSSGCDSTVLLHGLHQLGWKKLVVCHLDHQLRGRTSAADARFVARQAEALGLPCELGRTDVKSLARERNLSMETAARAARHEFFAACAAKYRCPRLLLAHHADDQVETVLMHLFRGAGLAGLGGMASASQFHAGPKRRPITLLRPLLGIFRSEIAAFAAAARVPFREDASNESSDHLRNRVRHDLIPYLPTVFQRNVRPVLLRLSDIVRAEEAVLQEAAAAFPLTDKLPVRPLREQPAALQRRILNAWLKSKQLPDLSFDLVESIRDLLRPGGPPRANLTRGRQIRRRAGLLWLE